LRIKEINLCILLRIKEINLEIFFFVKVRIKLFKFPLNCRHAREEREEHRAAAQRDMLAYIPVCADSSYPSIPSIGKRARNLLALKWREQADKDKSIQALQNMFSIWQPSAEQSAHKQNVSSNIDLEQRISALEVRMENKVKYLIKHAVQLLTQDLLQDSHVRLEQERLEIQKLMHLKSHEILSEIKPELVAAVNKAVCPVSTKNSLNISSPYFNDILTHEPIARRGPRTPRGRPTLPHDSPRVERPGGDSTWVH
jgi:hypothetical protein